MCISLEVHVCSCVSVSVIVCDLCVSACVGPCVSVSVSVCGDRVGVSVSMRVPFNVCLVRVPASAYLFCHVLVSINVV
jgi:hypothetical protein